MTDKEKLTAIVELAIEGGWRDKEYMVKVNLYDKIDLWYGGLIFQSYSFLELVADHAFMEAVYGDEKDCYSDDNCPYAAEVHDVVCNNCPYYELIFKHHMQQSIILPASERIGYLARAAGIT